MTPQMVMMITAKKDTRAFGEVVTDAQRVQAQLISTGNGAAHAMSGASLQTANLAAQFNDIGVMLASGQSPLILALQQGTQISQVLGPMGAGQAVGALKTAFMSLLNPVSLLTIGSIAAGAATVQWIMSLNQVEDVDTQLSEHRKMIDSIVSGYDHAQEAVDEYRKRANTLPVAEAKGDAETDKKNAQEGLARAIRQTVEAYHDYDMYLREFNSADQIEGALAQANALREIRDAAASAEPNLDAVIKSLKDFLTTDPQDVLETTAQQMLEGAKNAREFAKEVGAAQVVIDNLPGGATFVLKLKMEGFAEARTNLMDLMPDFRDEFTRKREEARGFFLKQMNSAPTRFHEDQANRDYAAVLAGINEEERRSQALKSGAAKDADRQAEAIRSLNSELDHELAIVGMSAREQEVLNNIRSAGVAVGTEEAATIRRKTEALFDMREHLEELDKQQRALEKSWKQVENAGVNAIEGIAAAMDDGVITGQEWLRIIMQLGRSLSQLDWGSLLGGLGGMGPGAASWNIPSGFQAGGFYPGLPGYADGTSYAQSGWAMVGENGPELMNMRGGETVLTAKQSLEALSGGGRSLRVEIYNEGGDAVEAKSASMTSQGEIDLVRIVTGVTKKNFADGTMDGVMKGVYGLNRVGR